MPVMARIILFYIGYVLKSYIHSIKMQKGQCAVSVVCLPSKITLDTPIRFGMMC